MPSPIIFDLYGTLANLWPVQRTTLCITLGNDVTPATLKEARVKGTCKLLALYNRFAKVSYSAEMFKKNTMPRNAHVLHNILIPISRYFSRSNLSPNCAAK